MFDRRKNTYTICKIKIAASALLLKVVRQKILLLVLYPYSPPLYREGDTPVRFLKYLPKNDNVVKFNISATS